MLFLEIVIVRLYDHLKFKEWKNSRVLRKNLLSLNYHSKLKCLGVILKLFVKLYKFVGQNFQKVIMFLSLYRVVNTDYRFKTIRKIVEIKK